MFVHIVCNREMVVCYCYVCTRVNYLITLMLLVRCRYCTIAAALFFTCQLSLNLCIIVYNREMAVCYVCTQVICLTTRLMLSRYLTELSSSGLTLEHLMKYNQHSGTGQLVTASFCVISYIILIIDLERQNCFKVGTDKPKLEVKTQDAVIIR